MGESGSAVEWICTQRRCFRPSLSWPFRPLLRLSLPRLTRDTWIRYRLPLSDLAPPPEGVRLTRIDAATMERLHRHPERDENQYQSALRFWRTGFGDGYLWQEDDEPLCLQWLITARHRAARDGLGEWAGMYPDLPAEMGVTEGIYTFRRGLRRRGGAATPMARALCHTARAQGLTELRTHIHSQNLGAHRWAARLGWIPYGVIHRCSLDLRGLRGRYVYLHERGDAAYTPPFARS